MVIGVLGFIAGRLMPKGWLMWDKAPWKSFSFEKNGKLYHAMGIRYWQNKVPDMSRIFPMLMPKKQLPKEVSEEKLVIMLRETCVAELVHWLLSIAGLRCLILWKGIGGVVVTLLYILFGNLPFIFIQRYNRPRLAVLLERKRKKAAKENAEEKEQMICVC